MVVRRSYPQGISDLSGYPQGLSPRLMTRERGGIVEL